MWMYCPGRAPEPMLMSMRTGELALPLMGELAPPLTHSTMVQAMAWGERELALATITLPLVDDFCSRDRRRKTHPPLGGEH